MQNSICNSTTDVFEMTFSQDIARESRIDKMKKFLSSPLTRKKPSGSHSKTFGASLDSLIQRAPSDTPVPFIVARICQYIENTGLIHEGLFRISGNARLIEKLKLCFDQSGDAPLETEGDVPSAAALLKLFLRELPEPIIPLSLHQQFLNSVKGQGKEESVEKLTALVEKLPFTNYNVLKYLSHFLLKVSQFEEQNRMSAASLGIVFGPNLFRVTDDYIGLKEQSLTNQIVTYFITDYYIIFQNAPKWYAPSSKMSVSLDSHLKHNNIAMSDADSMVASWPKLSSFPAMLSPLSFRPLSVSIPTMDDFPTSKSSGDNFNTEGILVINSERNEEHTSTCDQSFNQQETEDNESIQSSGKKQKEQKLVDESDSVFEEFDTAKLFPHVQHVQPQRNGNSNSSLKKTSSNSASSNCETLSMDTDGNGSIQDVNGGRSHNASMSNTSDIPPASESGTSIVAYAEVHDLGMRDELPRSDKAFSYSHKHYRHGRGMRSHYLKKQQSESKVSAHVSKTMSKQKSEPSLPCHQELQVLEPELKMDLAVTENTPDGTSEDQNSTWPILQRVQEDEAASISPIPHFLKISSSSEAPLSPSAFKSYLSHRSPHLDPNLPPSPPVEQEDLSIGANDDANKSMIKAVCKKIQGLKKKIKQFEENFEATYSYRLSYAEKNYYPDFKELMNELNQARQELKQLKEEPPILEVMPQQKNWPLKENNEELGMEKTNKKTNTCRFGMCLGPILKDNPPSSIEDSLDEALRYLADSRKSCERPEALEDMSKEELREEKYTIQKLLLQFEGLHGRPNSKHHRDLMRPLYDRYRNAKRILSRSSSFTSNSKTADAAELPPILEHETMDFKMSPNRATPLKNPEKDFSGVGEHNEDNDHVSSDNENAVNPGTEAQFQAEVDNSLNDGNSANLHELSQSELYDLQQKAWAEKRRLRKVLKEFELKFQVDNGRKVTREDKKQMEPTYGMYKNVRARLKLLQALATKPTK